MSEDRQERFAAYIHALAEVIGHADRAEPLRDYSLGLLLPGDRKSLEPIAAVTAPARVWPSTSRCCISSPTRRGRTSGFSAG